VIGSDPHASPSRFRPRRPRLGLPPHAKPHVVSPRSRQRPRARHHLRRRQIDIAIYDRFYSPLIFPYESGFPVPAESVYAIVEVKQVLTRQYMRDVGRKIGSVRRLNCTSVRVPYAGGSYPPKKPHRILGVLATPPTFTTGC
jgi:hypothetical protein